MHIALKSLTIPLVLLVGFYTPDVIKQLNIDINKDIKIRALAEYCMLSKQECIQDGIAITLENDTIKPLVTSQIKVKWQQANSDELTLKMQGLEGELGIVRYKLKRVANGYFEGSITLPVCTLDKMTWLGELTDGQKTVYPALRMES